MWQHMNNEYNWSDMIENFAMMLPINLRLTFASLMMKSKRTNKIKGKWIIPQYPQYTSKLISLHSSETSFPFFTHHAPIYPPNISFFSTSTVTLPRWKVFTNVRKQSHRITPYIFKGLTAAATRAISIPFSSYYTTRPSGASIPLHYTHGRDVHRSTVPRLDSVGWSR